MTITITITSTSTMAIPVLLPFLPPEVGLLVLHPVNAYPIPECLPGPHSVTILMCFFEKLATPVLVTRTPFSQRRPKSVS